MKKSYLIMAHDLPEQLYRLVSRLDDDESRFIIHIDARSDINTFKKLFSAKYEYAVYFLDDRIECYWGDYSLVEVMLCLLNFFIKNKEKDEYAVLLSGQDYPLVSCDRINDFLQKKKGINFQNIRPLDGAWSDIEVAKRTLFYRFNIGPEKHNSAHIPNIGSPYLLEKKWFSNLTNILNNTSLDISYKNSVLETISNPRNLPKFSMYAGSQWFAYTVDLIELIFDFLKVNPEYLRYHKYSHVPDEIFFPTIIKFIQGSISSVKVERCLTYANWSKQGVPLPVTFQMDDVGLLNEACSNFIFARKFNMNTSPDILDFIDNYLLKKAR